MKLEHLTCFNPKDCISGKVMRINRLTANIFRKHLKPFNITDSQISLLFVLTKAGPLTQKQLSDFIYMEKSTLNRNLNRLIDKNYITRNDFPLITITQTGKEFVNTIIPRWEDAMTEIRSIINKDGEEAISLVLQKLTQ